MVVHWAVHLAASLAENSVVRTVALKVVQTAGNSVASMVGNWADQ